MSEYSGQNREYREKPALPRRAKLGRLRIIFLLPVLIAQFYSGSECLTARGWYDLLNDCVKNRVGPYGHELSYDRQAWNTLTYQGFVQYLNWMVRMEPQYFVKHEGHRALGWAHDPDLDAPVRDYHWNKAEFEVFPRLGPAVIGADTRAFPTGEEE